MSTFLIKGTTFDSKQSMKASILQANISNRRQPRPSIPALSDADDDQSRTNFLLKVTQKCLNLRLGEVCLGLSGMVPKFLGRLRSLRIYYHRLECRKTHIIMSLSVHVSISKTRGCYVYMPQHCWVTYRDWMSTQSIGTRQDSTKYHMLLHMMLNFRVPVWIES